MSDPEIKVLAPSELDVATMYSLLRVRVDVFVVEQACPYAELDGRDLEPGTRHLWIAGDTGPIAYLRILDDDGEARIGRVLVTEPARGSGAAGRLMREAIEVIGPRASVLDAQSYLQSWYERFGYAITGPEFIEDGIPHVPMRRAAPAG